jgi:membrane protease subunit (stomatin/prohibitin family)
MGLIRAAVGAVGSTLHDQWKDFIRCEDLGQDILMKKVTTSNGIISKDSAIIVGPGQIAVIYDSGKILDATAEDGIYTFDQSSSPTFFAGQFGDVFKDMWARFTYNGTAPKEQAVFFINAKEIIDNKFGTPAPIPFQDWSHPVPNQMTNSLTPLRLDVKCFGKYTFRVSDPCVFMSKIAGTAEEYRKDTIVEQMRSEVIAAFQKVINELGNSVHKVPVLELPSKTDDIKQVMDSEVFDQPIRDRGLTIVGFAVESVTLDEESQKKIDNYELSANSFMQKGTLTGAYAQAVQDAANNQAGALNGMMGVGMVNVAAGGMMQGVANPQTPGTTIPVDPFAQQAPVVAAVPQAAEAPAETPVETPAEAPVEASEPVQEEAPAQEQ